MPLSERLRACEDRQRKLSATSGISYGPKTSSGKAESQPPPDPVPFEAERFLRPIRDSVEDLERALDAEEGLGPPKNVTLMRGEEKDAEIMRRWEGVDSKTVCQLAPHLGTSNRTIERARERLGVRPSDGLPKAERAA